MSTDDFRTAKPQTRNLSQYFDSLAAWVKTNVEPLGSATLINLEPTAEDANGFAGETFIVEISQGDKDAGVQKAMRCLLKRKPTGHIFFAEHDFAAEYLTQEFISTNGLAPIAPFIGYEAGSEVLGSPFYIIAFVEGRPTPDKPSPYHSGWLNEASAETQGAVCRSALQAMAKLGSRTIDELGLPWLKRAAPGQTSLEWNLEKWDRFSAVSWLDDEPLSVATEARHWLEENKPADTDKVITWGDARPGNMLFKETECNAIIDWDMVTAGDIEQDLGYWIRTDLTFQRFSSMAGGPASLPGWPSISEMVDIYEEALGRDLDRKRLRYHRIFASWQASCMYSRFNLMLNKANYNQYVSETTAPTLQGLREELERAHMPGDVN